MIALRASRAMPARGWLSMELVVAIGITTFMMLIFAAAVRQYSQAREIADSQRMLRLAAEAELNRARAGLDPARPGEPNGSDARGIETETSRTAGEGVWAGFERVAVRASRTLANGRRLQIESAAWIRVMVRP